MMFQAYYTSYLPSERRPTAVKARVGGRKVRHPYLLYVQCEVAVSKAEKRPRHRVFGWMGCLDRCEPNRSAVQIADR